jgi:glycosyltransferase involved in cell wall biosynthesis
MSTHATMTLTRGRAAPFDALITRDLPRTRMPLYPNVGIISPVLTTYGSQWTSRHQVLTRLARYFHVLWVPPAPEWRDALRDPRWRWREARIPGQPESFTVHQPPSWLPMLYRPQWVANTFARARLAAAHDTLRHRGCTRIVLYLWHVSFASTLDMVAHDLSLYHIYDEYSNAEVEQPLDPVEERLIRSVDQVITVSPTMFARKGGLNEHTARLTNGVQFEAFANPAPEPEDLARIPRPRLGYAGYIKKQLDWELLSALATRHPEWSFVFVGAMRPHPEIVPMLERMKALPNVHFLGSRTSAELARYPQHFDLCLMPYRVNDYSKYIYPLKLHEYLASGRPAISVPLPALAEVNGLVTVADGVEEWECAIARELAPGADTAARRAARQRVAREHDWDTIVDRIAHLILTRMPVAQGAA